MKGLLCSPNHYLVDIQVTGCLYRQTLECVAISQPFVSLSLLGGGVQKGILFSLFWNKRASFKGIYALNSVHIFFNTEIFDERVSHFKGFWDFKMVLNIM